MGKSLPPSSIAALICDIKIVIDQPMHETLTHPWIQVCMVERRTSSSCPAEKEREMVSEGL